MKRVAYLSVMFIALTLMSFSCEKEDPQPEPKVLTAQDIVGDWNFESLTVGTTVYDFPADSLEIVQTYNFGALSFEGVIATSTTSGKFTLRNHETYDAAFLDNFTLTDNVINFFDGMLIFSIENAQTFNGSELVLKLTSANNTTGKPIGGIYRLSHSN